MIALNKPYLPDISRYQHYLSAIYEHNWLTNNGPLVQELKKRLEDYLCVKNLLLVANGTLALQIACKVFNLKGNAVTTPFTFIATSSSLKWEGVEPAFADIDPHTFDLCPDNAENAINVNTSALVPVHVYGNPCDVDKFERIGQKKNIKIIYDAAHAFGVQLKGKSIFNYGDASTLSFHATKLFHSVEGGGIVFSNNQDYEKACKIINFGIDVTDGEILEEGINAKMSEFHAAMGLAVLDNIDMIIERRCSLYHLYRHHLMNVIQLQSWHPDATCNGAYLPVLFETAEQCQLTLSFLAEKGIMVRRYFSPSLNTVCHLSEKRISIPFSESYASRVLCLPLYFSLTDEEVICVCKNTKKSFL